MTPKLEADFQREQALLEAESIGWLPLEPGAYLHVEDENATEVLIVGIPKAAVELAPFDWTEFPRR